MGLDFTPLAFFALIGIGAVLGIIFGALLGLIGLLFGLPFGAFTTGGAILGIAGGMLASVML